MKRDTSSFETSSPNSLKPRYRSGMLADPFPDSLKILKASMRLKSVLRLSYIFAFSIFFSSSS